MKRTIAAVAVALILALLLEGTVGAGEAAKRRGTPGLDPSLGGGKASVPTGERFRVFILAGQSNMVGQGQAPELTEPYTKPHDRIRIWADGQWQVLVPSRRFGPEVGFAHALAKAWPEDTIGIIKVAIGGTGILAFVPDWSKEQADRTGDGHKGPLYKTIMGCVRDARKQGDFRVSGFVWKQGGKDMRNPETAREYVGHFKRLITGLRKDTGVADLPAFISTYRTREEIEKAADDPQVTALARSRPALLTVLRAHHEAAATIPHGVAVVHGPLPMRPDGIHFNTEGQLKQGRLIAEAVVTYYKEHGAQGAKE